MNGKAAKLARKTGSEAAKQTQDAVAPVLVAAQEYSFGLAARLSMLEGKISERDETDKAVRQRLSILESGGTMPRPMRAGTVVVDATTLNTLVLAQEGYDQFRREWRSYAFFAARDFAGRRFWERFRWLLLGR